MQTLRIVESALEGRFIEREIPDGLTAGELRKAMGRPSAEITQGGRTLADSDVIGEGLVIAKVAPGELGLLAMILVSLLVSAVVGTASYFIAEALAPDVPAMEAVQPSPSLRGSANTARKGKRLPILLGRHRVYPDVAALPYSTFHGEDGETQKLHQLFCFGYAGQVAIDETTYKIGETLLSNFAGSLAEEGLGAAYAGRVVEARYHILLTNDGAPEEVVRTTVSGASGITVVLSAPSGLYSYDGRGRRGPVEVRLSVEWRPEGSEAPWQGSRDIVVERNADVWRHEYHFEPAGSDDGVYEVRVRRESPQSDAAGVADSVYLDSIRCQVSNPSLPAADRDKPVLRPELYKLIGLETTASDHLYGVADEFNAVCTLVARDWDGLGTGPGHWPASPTRNPASAMLHLLTDPMANPEPVADSLIDWPAFEEFHAYCAEMSFNCDAWVTGEFTVRQLCDLVAKSSRARLVVTCDRISVMADKPRPWATQLFTPKNAWDFAMARSFAEKPRNLVVKFVDPSAGYVAVERTLSVDASGRIACDQRQEDGGSLTIETFGVANAGHAAKLGAFALKQLYARSRTYSWKTDIEGVVCLPGDVVLLANDNFLFGGGAARVVRTWSGGDGVTAVLLDEPFTMEEGRSYSLTVRTADGAVSGPHSLVTQPGRRAKLAFAAPLAADIAEGDLAAFGEAGAEAHKVLVTSVTPDQNRSCSFEAVDYAEEIFSDDFEIPAYSSGISKYPDDFGSTDPSDLRMGRAKGAKGDRGERGISISAVSSQFKLGLTDAAEPPGAWADTRPTRPAGLYLWTRDKVVYSDGSESYTAARCVTGNKGDTGRQGLPGRDAGRYRGRAAAAPADAVGGDYFLYSGQTGDGFVYGHIYERAGDAWVETIRSDRVMGCLADALAMAAASGEYVYAAALFDDLLVAKNLVVGEGGVGNGPLVRFLADDGSGKPLVEIRKGGSKLFYLDTETGKLYANFAEVTQYLPFTFNDSVDPTHPATFSFFIPEGATVQWVRLRVRAQNFRAYSKSASTAGGTETSSSGPQNGNDFTIGLKREYEDGETGQAGGHAHTYTEATSTELASSGGTIGSTTIEANGTTDDTTIRASGNTEDQEPGGYTETSVISFSGSTATAEATAGGHSHDIGLTGVGSHLHIVKGGSHNHSFSFSGSHNHSYSFSSSHSHTLSGTSHSHLLDTKDASTSNAANHKHSVRIPDYTLEITGTLDHTHSVNLSHSHSLEMGIIEGALASGLKWALDEGSGFGAAQAMSPGEEVPIAVGGPGWKDLRISSATLGRIQAQIIAKVKIDTYADL